MQSPWPRSRRTLEATRSRIVSFVQYFPKYYFMKLCRENCMFEIFNVIFCSMCYVFMRILCQVWLNDFWLKIQTFWNFYKLSFDFKLKLAWMSCLSNLLSFKKNFLKIFWKSIRQYIFWIHLSKEFS